MLVRLTANDVNDNWALVRHVIKEAHPKGITLSEQFYRGVLDKIYAEVIQVWAGYEDGQLKGMVLTEIQQDPYAHSNVLLIFAIYGSDPLNFDHWRRAYTDLAEFARLCNCSAITGFTDFDGVVEHAKKLGAVHRHFIILEI